MEIHVSETKLELFEKGSWMCKVPPVPTRFWGPGDWCAHIDQCGMWVKWRHAGLRPLWQTGKGWYGPELYDSEDEAHKALAAKMEQFGVKLEVLPVTVIPRAA